MIKGEEVGRNTVDGTIRSTRDGRDERTRDGAKKRQP
jgi:hypothetical protein